MIELILGRSASGKSSYLYQKAAHCQDVCLLVPEQESMETERMLQERFGDRVQVLSFHRLCDALQRKYGGCARQRLGQVAKTAMLYRAVDAVRPRLKFYRKSAGMLSFYEKIEPVMDDFAAYGAVGEQILPLLEDRPQYGKYHDLFLIYESYKALSARQYRDHFDDLDSAARALQAHDFFAGKTVMIDGFVGFTAQEYKILEHIFLQSENVFVTFTAHPDDRLFHVVTAHVRRMEKLLEQYGLRYERRLLEGNFRAKSAALAVIEAHAFDNVPLPPQPADGSVRVFGAAEPQKEVALIAADIRQKVLSGQCRYRDIALVSNAAQTYQPIVESVFRRVEIPLHTDRKPDALGKPLFSLILHAFDAVEYGYRYEDMISLAKTYLCGADFEAVATLENYVFLWNIRGAKWKMPWTQSPFGLEDGDEAEKQRRLSLINRTRERLMEPLEQFKEDTAPGKAVDLLRAVWDLLQNYQTADHLEAFARKERDKAAAEEWLRSYELLTELLDQLALALGDTVITRKTLHDMMAVCLRRYQFGVLPTYMDQVTFYDMVRARPKEVKYLYVLGAGQGQFPADVSGGSMITDRDIQFFKANQISLSKDSETVASEQRLYIYRSLAAAVEGITFSFSDFSQTGEPIGMSPLLMRICEIAAQGKIVRPSVPLTHPKDILQYLCTLPAHDPRMEKWAPFIRQQFGISPEALLPAENKGDRLSREMVEALYHKELSASQSRLESFAACPFRFFLAYGLQINEEEKVTFAANYIGDFVHYGMEQLMRRIAADGSVQNWDDRRVTEFLRQTAAEYAKDNLFDMTGARFEHLFHRITRTLILAGRSAVDELRHSKFFPRLMEYHFEKQLPLGDGFSAKINGYIDRVDEALIDGQRYIKVIDYKTGEKKIDLEKIYNGYQMQLPLYTKMLLDEPEMKDARVASMGYFMASVPVFHKPVEEDAALCDQFKRDELYLSEPEIVQAMDNTQAGAYAASILKKDGAFRAGAATADAAQLDLLGEFVVRKTTQIMQQIAHGDVSVRPMKQGVNACQYCRFDGICRFESGKGETCPYTKVEKGAFFERIGGEK